MTSTYVNNIVNVIGDKNRLMVNYFNKESLFDFNKVIPITLEETDKLTQWQELELYVNRWGTTRNCFNQQVSSPVSFTFQTTWGPPIPIFKKLSQLHPELTFVINYFVCDNDEYSGGFLIFKDGKMTGRTCHEPNKPLNTNKLFRHKL